MLGLVNRLIDLYTLIVFVAVILSWVPLPNNHVLVSTINKFVDPVLNPIRRVLPAMSGIDFSPMVLIVGLQVLKNTLL